MYIHRHNAALRVLYYHLRHVYGVDENPVLPYAPSEIEAVVVNEKCRIYWNYAFSTTRKLQATKPDIVLLDHMQKEMYVIEFSCPAETNITIKEDEKKDKYRDLLVELRQQYPGHVIKLVVLIIGALGGMKDSFLQELDKIPACRSKTQVLACKMQKAAILGSLRVIRAHEVA